MSNIAKTSITSSCSCGLSTFSFSIPNELLPLPTYLCHCNTSRRISGALCTTYVDIPLKPGDPKPDLDSLTAYASSDILTRYFCPTCGTHLYLKYNSDGHLSVSTGSLDRTDGVVEFKGHMWISDTNDGGASDLIPSINETPLKRWASEALTSPELARGWKHTTPNPNKPTFPPPPAEKLHAHCHCNGVSFYISRPDTLSHVATSPFPDLLVPYHSSTSPANPTNTPWWLPTPTQYLAGTCACTSCRRSSGFEITWWAFVPAANISLSDSSPFERYFGTQTAYRSANHCVRTFCRVCGSTVFWDGDERPTIVDIAVGLLDAPEGARAEEWVRWCDKRVSFAELGRAGGFVKGLEEGLKRYGDERDEKEGTVDITT
ncbi:uncharacterized protein BDZ99DRAFT_458940 [Mytilinidion resinicola]|uniref:CENP-V/GFA domain-containing protein n=1 Tax=Mytilinidion resinicola TaxID=574789 RepID=A0A6A6Z2F3_9PEZI|nr:uncharacterized protein BDZ99DRAFT_458940 [Mytilinidion resinicola]KAF2814988.1 hypothetical protein BDZ99DRAFT_458940 [Mytilinidion resinicola]